MTRKTGRTLAASGRKKTGDALPSIMEERLNIWLPTELRARIKERARQEGRKESQMVRRLCEIGLLVPGRES